MQQQITMKASSLKDQIGDSESSGDNKITKAIDDALSSNDKVIEIRPAEKSSGMGLGRFLLLGASAVGLAYWVRNSQKPDELIGSVKEKTADRTHEAAQTIEEGSETASERIEESSEQAGKAVQDAGETVADHTEEAGEKASEESEESDSDTPGSPGS